MMKRCFKCGEAKDLSAFYPHPGMSDGHLNKCKDCTKKDVKARYDAKHAEVMAYERRRSQEPRRKAMKVEYQRHHRLVNPQKYKARQAVDNAVRDGRLRREPCERCGQSVDVQGHHDDYGKPLEVRWLCFKCHRETHGQRVEAS